jgi:hypothetical protein
VRAGGVCALPSPSGNAPLRIRDRTIFFENVSLKQLILKDERRVFPGSF